MKFHENRQEKIIEKKKHYKNNKDFRWKQKNNLEQCNNLGVTTVTSFSFFKCWFNGRKLILTAESVKRMFATVKSALTAANEKLGIPLLVQFLYFDRDVQAYVLFC